MLFAAASIAVVLLTALPLIRLSSVRLPFTLASQDFVPHHHPGGGPNPSFEMATSNSDRRSMEKCIVDGCKDELWSDLEAAMRMKVQKDNSGISTFEDIHFHTRLCLLYTI